jgi:hypothetical protein
MGRPKGDTIKTPPIFLFFFICLVISKYERDQSSRLTSKKIGSKPELIIE